ncbi:uncharacterized protein L201_000115 [Kwoniella dendrophila CBS 6074]|uniref:separase n=1 Tax=Kwoniella dendrophila CBS 6074 TaxID=1295534 RepID=A0AAX4JK36_9TREE
MPAAKTATVAKTAPPAPRKTRATRATATTSQSKSDADDLVEGLGKLNIGQPSQPVKRVTKASTSKVTSASSSKTTATASSTVNKDSTTATRTTTARKIPPITTAASASKDVKGKAKAIDVQDGPQWARSEDNDMKPVDRVRAAMQAVNTSSKSLSSAISSGFKYSPVTASHQLNGVKAVEKEEKEVWTNDKIDGVLNTCQAAFRVLRELDQQGHLAGKGLDVERSSVSVIGKCVSLGMYRKAIDMLLAGRLAVLRLYNSQAIPPKTASSSTTASTSTASRIQPTSSKSTSKATSTVSTARSRTAMTSKAGPSSRSTAIPQEWLEMARLPAWQEGTEVSEIVKNVLFSTMMAAWICLVVLSKDVDELLPILSIPSTSSQLTNHYLNPITLALSLQISNITFYLHQFYRQVSSLSVTPTSASYLHLRHLSLLAMGITIPSSPESRSTPTQYWDTVHRTILAFIKEDEQKERLQDAAKTVDDIVEFIEGMVQKRGEKGWFEGKGWLGMVEMWIGLGRRLGDSDIIDKPLALLAASTSIKNSSPSPIIQQAVPSTPPSSSTIVSVPRTSEPKSIPKKIKNPETEIARICGDLAKASLALDRAISSKNPDPSTLTKQLDPAEPILLACSITSLSANEELLTIAGKAIRAFERVRRGYLKLLEGLSQPNAGDKSNNGVQAIRDWLEKSIEFVEIVINESNLDTSLSKEVVSSLIDTITQMFRPPIPYSTSYPFLIRARKVIQQTSVHASNLDQAEWLRCISTMAYNGAGQLYKSNNFDEASKMCKDSCDWTIEALRLIEGESRANDKNFVLLKDSISKRWELLAGCYQRLGKRDDMFTIYSYVLASQPASTLSQISLAISSRSIQAAFEPYRELTSSMTRLASLILYEPALYLTHGKELVRLMQDHDCSSAVIGAMGEKLLCMIEEGEWKEESAKVSIELAEAVLQLYDQEYPVRKIRVLSKMMGVILTSGQNIDKFDSLAEEVIQVSSQTDAGQDVGLLPFKSEYLANTLILQAMQAYHASSHPSLEVTEASKQAIEKLRTIIIPPTTLSTFKASTEQPEEIRKKVPPGRSTTTKAVASRPTRGTARTVSEPKKAVTTKTVTKTATAKTKRRSSLGPTLVFDDLKRLTRLLGSLSTLLGLLGHTLQQIEALKLLRAFQRHREDLADDYILRSCQLATEYQKLGKTSRAGFVFSQAQKVIEHSKVMISAKIRVETNLRHACYLASTGDIAKAQRLYDEASSIENDIEENKTGTYVARVVDRCGKLERSAWARRAIASIYAAQDNAVAAILQLSASFRLFSRASDAICRLASATPLSPASKTKPLQDDDPFGAPLPPSAKAKVDGADDPSKDSKTAIPSQTTHFTGKHLHSLQWHIAASLLSTILDLSNAFAYRGTVKDCEYFLKIANGVAGAVKSDVMLARIGAKEAELYFRMKKWEEMGEKLEGAAGSLNTIEGPDMIDLNVLKGDLYSRTEMIEEAEQVFQTTSKEIEGLDKVFVANEAVLPTPRKNALLTASTSSVRASLTASKLGKQVEEPLLPNTLAHVLRQYAWLLKEAGSKEECENLLSQIRNLPSSTETKAEELLLEGRIALHEAFSTFKTDLFMSSLTESAVAMPMGGPSKRVFDRQSTRQSIQTVLTRAEEAFLSALSLVTGSGKIEDIRQACLALALLRTFQTSLGQGSEDVTASAANMLASSSAITLQREMLEAIECKFVDIGIDDLKWPTLSANLTQDTQNNQDVQVDQSIEIETDNLDDRNGQLKTYWNTIKAKHNSTPLLTSDSQSLDSLPPEWAVISINVTDDRNTMFISRHQRDHKPLVFCLPLDRQGRREGEDDSLTFDSALEEMKDIIKCSNDTARTAKNVVTREDKLAWWEERYRLDSKLKDLCESIEFVWLGAFKTIFSPRLPNSASLIDDLKQRLEKIFDSALSSTSGGVANPRSRATIIPTTKVHLDDTLLECFVNLSSKCKDEEVEDLVYFILDVYQFHGVPVALSELDIDQIAIDVKGALEKIETRITFSGLSPLKDEHLFLALDKNAQPFPWESIPTLRGRPISRIPSLSFLLDQVAMGNHLRPSLTQSTVIPPRINGELAEAQATIDTRRTVNSRRTFYILNPSGDLDRTEQHFKPWIDDMVKKAGWKGIIGRPPTELELAAALKDYDLVLYFGHGGAEQYIRSHKIRHLPQCATTMLWGCSSGHLKDQGDLDRTGTAWHYMVGGCPSLTANLWDVTDRDIDRLSAHVLKILHLDSAHLPESKSRPNTFLPLSELSTVQAVNSSRDECKLKYLTGAAPVVYGLPVWLH